MATPGSSCIYEVTATCVDYIIRRLGFEGVVYPSVPSEGEGLNICLTPKVVDKKVMFESAIAEIVIRKDMKSTIRIIEHAQMVTPTTFNWKVTDDGKRLMEMTGQFPHVMKTEELILTPKDSFYHAIVLPFICRLRRCFYGNFVD